MSKFETKRGRSLTWVLPPLAIVVGISIGAFTAFGKFQEPELRLAGHEVTANAKPAPIEDAKPRVHLPHGDDYEFGVMAREEEQSHTFQVQNIGNGPLTLKVLDTTCKCTVGSLEKDAIAPGETADVTLTWVARSYDREFRQSATIETNDQSQREIVFSISGKVLQLALPDVPQVKFSRVSRSEPLSLFVKVYGYRDTDLVITGHNFSDDSLAEFFSVKTEPLAKEEWEDPEAKSAILATIDIKPGLPMGVVRQIIALETNKSDIAPMDVAIDMTVVSDIGVLGGKKFNDETNVLQIGPVDRNEGHSSRLFMMVKGKYKQQVEFSVKEIDPESALEVEIGEPVDLKITNADGQETVNSRRFGLKISVKEGSPPVQRLGSKQGALGRIVFNTNHPEIPEFTIKVQFAVQ